MNRIFNRIRHNLLSEGKMQTYIRYAVGEIILVVIGILIALQINNWNVTLNQRHAEEIYLKEMLEDYQSNLQRSNDTIDLIEELIPELIVVLEQSALPNPTISIDSLNYVFSSTLMMPTYKSTDRVYQNLIGSGDFKLISSRELKNEIANYYKAVDLIELVQKTHELELVNSIQPYIMKKMDFQSVGLYELEKWKIPREKDNSTILKVLKSRELKNVIILKLSILSDLLAQNENIKEINSKLITILEEQINNN